MRSRTRQRPVVQLARPVPLALRGSAAPMNSALHPGGHRVGPPRSPPCRPGRSGEPSCRRRSTLRGGRFLNDEVHHLADVAAGLPSPHDAAVARPASMVEFSMFLPVRPGMLAVTMGGSTASAMAVKCCRSPPLRGLVVVGGHLRVASALASWRRAPGGWRLAQPVLLEPAPAVTGTLRRACSTVMQITASVSSAEGGWGSRRWCPPGPGHR